MFKQRISHTRTMRRRGIGRVAIVLILSGVVAIAAAIGYVILFSHTCGGRIDAQMYQEVSKLYGAMESFKEKFTALPPCTNDERRFTRFVSRAFPKYEAGVSTPMPEKIDAAEALVFWLRGVGTNPADPFSSDADDRYIFFEFPESRVRDGRFYPPVNVETDPYVYFYYEDYGNAEYKGFRPYRWPDGEDRRGHEYFAPETCQIIGPGKDGKLGRGGSLTELSEEDLDNIVSFSTLRVGDIDPNQ